MTTLHSQPTKREAISLTQLIVIALLLSFGVVLLLFSLIYVHDVRTLRDLPGTVWSFICGVPDENGAGLPILILLSVLAFAGAGLTWGWQRLQRGRALIIVGGLAVLLLTGIVALRSLQAVLEAPAAAVVRTPGFTYLDQPRLLTDFALPGIDGQPLRLSDLQGRHTLLFFGYSHCPDFCPTTLAEMKRVRMLLGADADRVNVLFVSVDGQRDTPELLGSFLRRFDPAFYGMSGEPVTLAQITPDYGLYYTIGEPDAGGDYLVDHSVPVYLIDPERRLRAIIEYGTRAETIVEGLRAEFAAR